LDPVPGPDAVDDPDAGLQRGHRPARRPAGRDLLLRPRHPLHPGRARLPQGARCLLLLQASPGRRDADRRTHAGRRRSVDGHRLVARHGDLVAGQSVLRGERVNELNLREFARWTWRQLTSMRTALFLLLLLASAAVPGSVVPQAGVAALTASQWPY